MGLKILHSADWHLDSPFSGFNPEQRTYLKRELLKIPGKIADLCRREGCDLVFLSGDLFDGAYSSESLRETRYALESCGVPVVISPGNHDFVAPGSPWMEEIWPENVHIFTGGMNSVVIPRLDCRIYGAGYRSMDCEAMLEGFHASGDEKYHLAVLHGDAVQPRSPYCPVTAAQVRESGLDYLALGHVHKAGYFRAGDTLCAWPGAPMGRGYDELGVKGAYIVTLGTQTDVRFVPLDTPRFWDMELDTDRETLSGVLPPVGNMDFYRITLRGSGAADLSGDGFPNLTLIDRREEKQDFWQTAGEDTLEGTFFRLLRAKMASADPEEQRCIGMAAEISARLLRGREVEV